MALTITGVDLTLIGWLSRNGGHTPVEALDRAVAHFAKMGGRLGHHLAESGLTHALGIHEHDGLIKTLQGRSYGTDGAGTLHARIESADETASWQNGTLTLDRRAHRIPETVLADLVGRRLRDVVDADWLPATARIVDVTDNQINVMLLCDTWIVPLAEARETLSGRKRP